MVQSREQIEELRKAFDYKFGKLYWAKGRRLYPKEAGYKNKSGYTEIRVNILGKNQLYLSHQIIFALHNGYIPELIDHIDRDTSNNSINNLREANKTINSVNTGLSEANRSGIKGVYFHKNKYEAFIYIREYGKRKKIHLGRFNTIEDAKSARKEAERTYWSNF